MSKRRLADLSGSDSSDTEDKIKKAKLKLGADKKELQARITKFNAKQDRKDEEQLQLAARAAELQSLQKQALTRAPIASVAEVPARPWVPWAGKSKKKKSNSSPAKTRKKKKKNMEEAPVPPPSPPLRPPVRKKAVVDDRVVPTVSLGEAMPVSFRPVAKCPSTLQAFHLWCGRKVMKYFVQASRAGPGVGWVLGTINKFRPNVSASNCEIQWAGERGPRNQLLDPREYFVQDSMSSIPPAGAWFFIKPLML